MTSKIKTPEQKEQRNRISLINHNRREILKEHLTETYPELPEQAVLVH